LAFCYLSNNYGFTGDWFVGEIKELTPGPTLKWFKHCFAPAAVFIDRTDGRYVKQTPPEKPGSNLVFNCVAVNDYGHSESGTVVLKLLNSQGREISQTSRNLVIPAYDKTIFPTVIALPKKVGGYTLLAEFTPKEDPVAQPILSRRFLKVGTADRYTFFEGAP